MIGAFNINARMGLGTAEFGMNYGISNTRGKPDESEAQQILLQAVSAGFRYLDTAPGYGNSEDILGRCLPVNHTFRIITKTPAFASSSTRERAQELETCFLRSLTKLRQLKLYGLLMHRAEDLLAPEGEILWDVMQQLKRKGLVEKIGVSVYTPDQVERLINRYALDMIQVPIHVLDQRLLKKDLLRALKKRKTEIHARSIFFQGVLLMPLDQLPDHLAGVKPSLERYADFRLREDLSPVQAALLFAASQPEIDNILVGVNSMQEITNILKALKHLPEKKLDWSALACPREDLLDPRRWPASHGR